MSGLKGTIPRDEIIVGLDIGTTKISAIVAEVSSSLEPKIIGLGTVPSRGLRRGVVVNLEETVSSIRKAVSEAELMAGIEIKAVYAGIAGDHIRSFNRRGIVAVSGPNNEVVQSDVDRVIDSARAVFIPLDQEIIHILPQEFIVDDQPGIKDPVGMSGVRLEAEVHIVTGAVMSARNIYKSIEQAGIKVRDIVLEPLASSYAVLSPDERELGVALVDIGGGTTDVALFFEGSIRHSAVIGLGGENVTHDLAIMLRTPIDKAEEIKKRYGCALNSLVNEQEIIEVPGLGGRDGREISRRYLSNIIEARMEEIYAFVKQELNKSEYSTLMTAGIVLTGGGSLLEGSVELAEQVFGVPTKLGSPQRVTGLVDVVSSPVYAAGVGLVLWAHMQGWKDGDVIEVKSNGVWKKIFNKMKILAKEFV